jgi:maleylacetate reductase
MPVPEMLRPRCKRWSIVKTLGAPVALKDFGMLESELGRCFEITSGNVHWKPPSVEEGSILNLLEDACHGSEPGT